jgi:DNA-binding HxlR family transcriptional regulator
MVLDRANALIVWRLFWGARPFYDLLRHIPGISRKDLRSHLAQMERQGLVTRRLLAGVSRKAEYALTPLGETLKPVVGVLYEWGLVFGSRPPAGADRLAGGPSAAPRHPPPVPRTGAA